MMLTPRGRPEGGRFGLGPLLLSLVLSMLRFLALRPAVDRFFGWHVETIDSVGVALQRPQ